MIRQFALVCFSLCFSLSAALAGPVDNLPASVAEAIDATLTDEMKAQELVGVALGIAHKGEVIYLQGYGAADQRNNIPVSTDTSFRWASISKLVTALAAMQLWEQGKLDLDADIRTYVPEFPDKGVKITTRQLLAHLGGIVHYSNGEVIKTEHEYDVEHPHESVILSLDVFKESPLIAEPGTKFSYTTHGYILLSAVVERAGGQKFADQCRERIFGPAGMTTMQPDYPWVDIPNRTEGYYMSRRGPRQSADRTVHWKLGGGGFTSTIGDLTAFGMNILEGGLVTPATMKLMWDDQSLNDGTPIGRGLGFDIQGEGRDFAVLHSGSQNKTRTLLVMLPERDIVYAFMTNSEYADLNGFTKPILDIVREYADAESGQ